MQFLTLWTSLNYGLLRFNYSISLQYGLTACTRARKSTADYWLTSSRRLLCAFLARGLKMASMEIQHVSDSDQKGENYQRALILLNEVVDILRSLNDPWSRSWWLCVIKWWRVKLGYNFTCVLSKSRLGKLLGFWTKRKWNYSLISRVYHLITY